MDHWKTITTVFLGVLSGLSKQVIYDIPSQTPPQEAWTTWLTWAILYPCFALCARRYRSGSAREDDCDRPIDHGASWHVKVLAMAISGVAAQATQHRGILPSVIPLITLTVVVANVAARSGPEAEDVEKDNWGSQNETQISSILSIRMPRQHRGTIVLSLVLCLLFAASNPLDIMLRPGAVMNSGLFLLSRVATFALYTGLLSQKYPSRPEHRPAFHWDVFEWLSVYSLACCSCWLVYSGLEPAMPGWTSFLRAANEAGWWFTLFVLLSECGSIPATTIETVSASLQLGLYGSHASPISLLALLSAFGSIWQCVMNISTQNRYRNLLYILILLPLVGRMDFNHQRPQSVPIEMHPVDELVLDARAQFSLMLQRQSRTVEQATAEYQRRYRRRPPPMFDWWAELAIEHDFALLDEFDGFMESLEPFWSVPPATLRSAVETSLAQHPDLLIRFELRNRKVVVQEQSSQFGAAFAGWLPPEWARMLPNMTLAISSPGGPGVCVPREALDEAMRASPPKHELRRPTGETTTHGSGSSPKFVDFGGRGVWDEMTVSCPSQSPARKPACSPQGLDRNRALPFVRNLTASRDLCGHCKLPDSEEILTARDPTKLTHSLVPIWSQSKLSSFNDIIMPSPLYPAKSDLHAKDEDPTWYMKDDKVFWAGSATDMSATGSKWTQIQRQRLALMTQTGGHKPIRLLGERAPGYWEPYNANISDVSTLFSTGVVKAAAGCQGAACHAEKNVLGLEVHNVSSSLKTALAHKFVLDIDGDGVEGQFYRLLRSRSLVLKPALFAEWHDDRIMPWVHYIPVSSSFEELPELARYLTSTQKGKETARQIAQEGRDWAGKALREYDIQIVWLRMLLEYGRLTHPSRELL